jgi:hypothetical protein
MLVRCFLAYMKHFAQTGFTGDYFSITQASFDQFRIGPANKAYCQYHPPMPTSTQRNPSTSSSYDTSPAQMFCRKIKADPSLFPVLKGENYHDLWHHLFGKQARAQDVSEVLDSTYIPVNQDEINLFSEKQKFLYADLETKVLTDRGKAIIVTMKMT